MNSEHELKHWIAGVADITPEDKSFDELREILKEYVQQLLNRDMEKLLFTLYRIDVDEHKLKELLAQNADKEPAVIITDAIIERQKQKIESRKKYSPENNRETEW